MRSALLMCLLAVAGCLVIERHPAPAPPPRSVPVTGNASSSSCSGGRTLCDGACRDMRYDADNCGACGRVCAQGETCSDWRCVDLATMQPAMPTDAGTSAQPDASTPQQRCEHGRGDCDGNPANGCETDLFQDRNHCGACGARCERFCGGGGCI